MGSTGNPIGSNDYRDFYLNARNFDKALNDLINDDWTDRFGIKRKTWNGFQKDITSGALERRNGKIELRDWVSVFEFGVKYDDVTDNSDALTAAMTSGKRIYFPDPKGKPALVSKPVKWSSNTQIMGPGKDITVIKAMDSMPGELDLIHNENYLSPTLRYDRNLLAFDFCVDANGLKRKKTVSGEWGRALRLAAVFDSLMMRCKFIEGPQHCVDITNYNDTYIGIGHLGKPVGPSWNVVMADCEVQDYVYDDGITTHGSYSILIDNCVGRITDRAKTIRTYVTTQNAFEIDDGSWDVVVVDCRAYCNRTKSKGFSVATHANNPAAYNITFRDCIAYNAIIGFNAWADINTDIPYESNDWKCRNIVVENFTLREPFGDLTERNFPSRFFDISGFKNVRGDDLQVYMSNHDGVQDTPISIMHINNSIGVRLNRISIMGVKDDSVGSQVYRESGWIKLAGKTDDVYIDGFDIDNIGFCNRIVTDSENNALRLAKRFNIRKIPADGQIKKCIVSGSQNVVYEDIRVPEGMVPYQIGRSFTAYPAGDYEFNTNKPPKTVIGGLRIFSETLADGKQAKPGLMFDNQYYSSDMKSGKGTIAWRTSVTKEMPFSITAYHEDLDQYIPILAMWDRELETSIEGGRDDKVSLGRAQVRYKTGYFSSSPIITSDAREKTPTLAINDKLLDIGESISINMFKWLSSIQEKGEELARWHFGPYAQEIRDTFIAHGENGLEYGLLCYDKWDDEYQEEYEEIIKENGEIEHVPTGRKLLVREAGDRWGIRGDQCLWLVLAANNRKNERFEKRLKALEDLMNK